jgi:GT2 family glycosyltransferase
MRPVPEVAFVLAPRQNHFFVELSQALRDEIENHGVATSFHAGAFPLPRPGLVYALMPPHEYFTLMHGRVGPPPDVFARTIFICAEQPRTKFFEWNVEYGTRAGAIFDINRLGVQAFEQAGLHAEHIQLGYTSRWNAIAGKTEQRDIDVLFLGAATDRRLEYLAKASRPLRNRHCHFVISDNSRPNSKSTGSFVTDDEKWSLLARSKVLINLHQGETPYFEWLRVIQAMENGCVVVSESSLDYAPLVPGKHFLSGRPDSLGLLAERLLEDGHAWWEMQQAAFSFVHDELTMRSAGAALAAAAQRLDGAVVPDADHPFFWQREPREEDADAVIATFAARPEDTPERRVLKELKLDAIDLRRRLDRLSRELDGERVPTVELVARSAGWAAARSPKVSVLVTLYNYRDHIAGALDSLVVSNEPSWEVIVVDDGSGDGSGEVVRRWIAEHDSSAAIMLRHPINRGLGNTRDTALAFARGEFCFVLDADNEILPECFPRLLGALDADPQAAFAWGMLERFSRRGPIGLVNTFPWEPERFRDTNFIDAMALIRTDRLREMGGYRRDRPLHGWEDYDLWARMAEKGWHGAFVPSVVARYRSTDHSMLSLTNISGAEARSVIAEAAPSIMG